MIPRILNFRAIFGEDKAVTNFRSIFEYQYIDSHVQSNND